jgi:penicillin-binding protein 1C
LKPFIYGLGFEDGLIHPETLIDDIPARYGNYTPENFDQTFQGTVTVRRALQLSLNVPAIAVLGKVGVNRLSARLSQTGAALILPQGEAPGLAMGLGGVGVRLSDLVMLYSGLARLGAAVPLTERQGAPLENPRRLLDPVAAWYIGNILIGAPPPENAPQGRIAFKTGTSYGYRDAWAIGYDGRITIGVWVGRPDGAPVPGLVGRVSAAPILFDAFARSEFAPAPLPRAPRGAIFAASNKLPPPLQRFGTNERGQTAEPPRIMFPPDGARLEIATNGQADPIALKIIGGRAPLTIVVNGVPQTAQSGRHTLFFQPDGPGFVRLTVMDARGAADSVTVRLQ